MTWSGKYPQTHNETTYWLEEKCRNPRLKCSRFRLIIERNDNEWLVCFSISCINQTEKAYCFSDQSEAITRVFPRSRVRLPIFVSFSDWLTVRLRWWYDNHYKPGKQLEPVVQSKQKQNLSGCSIAQRFWIGNTPCQLMYKAYTLEKNSITPA